MSKIIDIEPLDCLAWKDGEHGTTFDDGVLWVLEKIGELPSIQPQPVVRCKDCKWCENANGSVCKNPASWVVATDRDFGCVLAERRTDETD